MCRPLAASVGLQAHGAASRCAGQRPARVSPCGCRGQLRLATHWPSVAPSFSTGARCWLRVTGRQCPVLAPGPGTAARSNCDLQGCLNRAENSAADSRGSGRRPGRRRRPTWRMDSGERNSGVPMRGLRGWSVAKTAEPKSMSRTCAVCRTRKPRPPFQVAEPNFPQTETVMEVHGSGVLLSSQRLSEMAGRAATPR